MSCSRVLATIISKTGEFPKFIARSLGKLLQRIDPLPALHGRVQLGNRCIWYRISIERRRDDFLSARNSSRHAPDTHPADHGVEGDELWNLWLAPLGRLAICLRCRNDEISEEVLS